MSKFLPGLYPPYWDYEYVTADLVFEPKNLCMPGKHSTNWSTSLVLHFYLYKEASMKMARQLAGAARV